MEFKSQYLPAATLNRFCGSDKALKDFGMVAKEFAGAKAGGPKSGGQWITGSCGSLCGGFFGR